MEKGFGVLQSLLQSVRVLLQRCEEAILGHMGLRRK